VTADGRYRANEPAVIHQVIDGEAVLIHLDQGLYYSLNETGARIWSWLNDGRTRDSIVETLSRTTTTARDEIAAGVDDIIARLTSEALLVPSPTDVPEPMQPDDGDPTNGSSNGAFVPPAMQRYDDLQDLLLLDPIHAVDESGWPDRRPDS
jgi:hypothetical protein